MTCGPWSIYVPKSQDAPLLFLATHLSGPWPSLPTLIQWSCRQVGEVGSSPTRQQGATHGMHLSRPHSLGLLGSDLG